MLPSPPSAARLSGGFTLIEVMVVVVIIGILINFAVLSLRSRSPEDQLNEESRRLKSLIEMASEEALLRSSFIGIDITDTGYGFLRLEEESWQPADDNLFRNRELPDEIQITLTTDQAQDEPLIALTPDQPPGEGEEKEKLTPEIILLNSGEITPFDLKISSNLSDDYYRLSGDETGEVVLDRVSAD